MSGGQNPGGAGGVEAMGGAGGTLGNEPVAPEEACVFAVHAAHDYFFCDSLVDAQTARDRCVSVGMNLTRIDDAEENAFINDQMTSQMCCPVSVGIDPQWSGLWIGGSDEQTEGTWVWDDAQVSFWMGVYNYNTMENGAAIDGSFASWGPNQPDDGYMANEDCLRTKGLVWHDTPCDPAVDQTGVFVGLGYICEQPSAP